MILDSLKVDDPMLEEAEFYFIKSIMAKKCEYSYYTYGCFLSQIKRYHLAEQCYLESLKLNPTFYPAMKEVKNNFFFFKFFINL